MSEIWGTRQDWSRAARAVALGVAVIGKKIVGADATPELGRLERLAAGGVADPARCLACGREVGGDTIHVTGIRCVEGRPEGAVTVHTSTLVAWDLGASDAADGGDPR